MWGLFDCLSKHGHAMREMNHRIATIIGNAHTFHQALINPDLYLNNYYET